MKSEHWAGIALAVVGLVVINKIAKSPACGPNCQVLLSDARGTLVQDIVTGVQYWI